MLFGLVVVPQAQVLYIYQIYKMQKYLMLCFFFIELLHCIQNLHLKNIKSAINISRRIEGVTAESTLTYLCVYFTICNENESEGAHIIQLC